MMKRPANELPSALDSIAHILETLGEGTPAIFLDYDGTLTPIVENPEDARLPERTRELLRRIAVRWPLVIITGRALEDIRSLVGLDDIIYAGSHGFNIAGDGDALREERGEEFLPSLDEAEKSLRDAVSDFDGVRVERKPYAIALHFRKADSGVEPKLESIVDEIASAHDDLRKSSGKKIFELRPDTDWDKGRALRHLLNTMHVDESRAVPLYIGDDTTDEDAFEAIADDGIGIRVGREDTETAASYRLDDTGAAADFLAVLADRAEEMRNTDAWSLVYTDYDPDSEKLREALCTLGNGYFATRGAAPESDAGEVHYPGTYVCGIYNRLESAVEGRTIENESLVNVPNWLPLSFRIDDGEPFDLSEVDILQYRQELDMRNGVLIRTVRFEDAKGRRTTCTQRRIVHMRYPHLAALETIIEAENWSGTVHVLSAIDGRVQNTLVERYRMLNNQHLEQRGAGTTDDGLIWLEVETSQSHVRVTEAARTMLYLDDRPVDSEQRAIEEDGYVGRQYAVDMHEGAYLRVEKTVALYHSRDFAISESRVEVLDRLRHAGSFEQLLHWHVIAWKQLWERWCMQAETESTRVSQVLNLHIFHLLQTVSPNTIDLDVGVPPRGLHGEAYRGLIMWDDLFIFPILNLRIPDITRTLLMYRYRRLPRAFWAAEEHDRQGAMFPWQSGSDGREQAQTLHLNPESGNWIPDNSQLQRHINLAVAYNIWQYYQVTGDKDFLAFYGAEMFIGIVRFWMSKAEYDEEDDRYDIRGVMGPDEFHDAYPDADEPGVDNNAYTNVMVAWILVRVLEMLSILPGRRRKFMMDDLALTQQDIDRWERISRRLRLVFHDDGIISQFEGYGDLEEFDWEGYREKYGDIHRLDRILEAEDDTPNRYKVSKQADLLMLFYLLSAEELQELFDRLGYPFDEETIPRHTEYYLDRTAHGSTLSRVVHAWVLARSQRGMSWRLFRDALESDIEDIQGGTTHEGIHLGAMAGTVDLILRCYSGIGSRNDVLWFNPRLPEELRSLEFNMQYRGCQLAVTITPEMIRLRSAADSPAAITIGFDGDTFALEPGSDKKLALPVSQ